VDLEVDDVDVTSLREDLELIGDSARLIVEVKENLLGPAREHQPRPIDLVDVVQAAAFYTGVSADNLHIDALPGARLALADSTQLTRALGNLLRNAVEANAGQTSVSIAPVSDEGEVVLTVTDDGDGIPPDVMDKIWAAFYTTKGPKHSGMGLPACLHILTQLNGRIAVESEPGVETTFTLTLPAAREIGPPDFSDAPDHILLIDDSDAWAMSVLETLTAADQHVTHRTAASPSAAAEADVILVDDTLVAAPVAEVLAALKAVGAAGKTVVIAPALRVERTTAYLRYGVRDVALKPYTPADLAELLR